MKAIYLPLASHLDSLSALSNFTYGQIRSKKWKQEYYRKIRDFEKSLILNQEILGIGNEMNDLSVIGDATLNIGIIYAKMDNSEKANTYFEKVISYANKTGDVHLSFSLENELGKLFFANQKFTESLSHLLKAEKLALENNDLKNANLIRNNIGISYISLGQPTKGIKFLKTYFDFIKNSKDSLQYAYAYGNLAYAYHKSNEFEKAFMYYDSSLYFSNLKSQHKTTSITYLDLSDAYEMKGEIENALEAYKKHSEYLKKAIQEENRGKITELEALFNAEQREKQLIKAQNKVLKLEQKIHHRNRTIYLTLIGLLSVLGLISFLYIKNKEKLKNQILAEELLNSQIQIKEIEAKQLHRKLEAKKSDITNLVLDIVRKNDFSTLLSEKLDQLKSKSPRENSPELREIISMVSNHLLMNNERQMLQENVDNINRKFNENLENNFSHLSANDRYLCGLIRIGLTNKDIATIRNITVDSAKTNRYRLRKKLDLKPEEDIVAFLQNI